MCCSNGSICVLAAGLRRTAVSDGGRRQQWRGDESTAQPHRQQQRRQEGESQLFTFFTRAASQEGVHLNL